MSYLEVVNGIWIEALEYCDVPERFHNKMRAQVRPSLFFRDGKFDKHAYEAAVQAEIDEWDSFLTPHIMGY